MKRVKIGVPIARERTRERKEDYEVDQRVSREPASGYPTLRLRAIDPAPELLDSDLAFLGPDVFFDLEVDGGGEGC